MSLFKYIIENKLDQLPNVDKDKFHDIFDKRIILMEYIMKLMFNFNCSVYNLKKYDIEFHKKINIKLTDYIIEKLTDRDVISKLNLKTYKEIIDLIISSEHSKKFTPLYPNLKNDLVRGDLLYRLDYDPKIKLSENLEAKIVHPIFNYNVEKSINKDNIVEIFTKLDPKKYNLLQFSTNNEYQQKIASLFCSINGHDQIHIDNSREYIKENKEFLQSLVKTKHYIRYSETFNKIITLCDHYKIDYSSLNVLNQLYELKPLQDLYIDKTKDSSIKNIYNIVTKENIESELIYEDINITVSRYTKGSLTDEEILKRINNKPLLTASALTDIKDLEYFCKWMLDNENMAKTYLPNHYKNLFEYIFEKIITMDDKIELVKMHYKNEKSKNIPFIAGIKLVSQALEKITISSSSDSESESDSDD